MPRRARGGACDRCRKRRVACDAQRPLCAACARRGELCTYRDSTSNMDEVAQTDVRVPLVNVTSLRTDRESSIYFQKLILPFRDEQIMNPLWPQLQTAFRDTHEPAVQAISMACFLVHDARAGRGRLNAKVAYFSLLDFAVRRLLRHGKEMPLSTWCFVSGHLTLAEIVRTADPMLFAKHSAFFSDMMITVNVARRRLPEKDVERSSESDLQLSSRMRGFSQACLVMAGLPYAFAPFDQQDGLDVDRSLDALRLLAALLRDILSQVIIAVSFHNRQSWIQVPSYDKLTTALNRWSHEFNNLLPRLSILTEQNWRLTFLSMHYHTGEYLISTLSDNPEQTILVSSLLTALDECENVTFELQAHGVSLQTPFRSYQPLGLISTLFVAGLHLTDTGANRARLMLLALSLTEGNWSSFSALQYLKFLGSGSFILDASGSERYSKDDLDAMRRGSLSIEARTTPEELETIERSFGYIRASVFPFTYKPTDPSIELLGRVFEQMEIAENARASENGGAETMSTTAASDAIRSIDGALEEVRSVCASESPRSSEV